MMTPEQKECVAAMPVVFVNDALPEGAPDARRLSRWEKNGWIQIVPDPHRWALSVEALATWAREER